MSIHSSTDEHNIVTLTFDRAGSVNLIDENFLREFDLAVTRVANEDSARGVILASAKETFFVGADIEMLYDATDAAQVFEMTQAFKATLRKLETLGKPVVAALNGSALGGGFEIALACHHRIALENKKAQFGFPEVTLGVFPAGGGVTRFVRMFGLQTALPYLVEGTRLNVQEAKDAGWIDEIVSTNDELMPRAREWILQNPRAQQAWDADGYRIPGATRVVPPSCRNFCRLRPRCSRKKRIAIIPRRKRF